MHGPNVERLVRELPADAVVLDVGGWACPFNRAQWVLDAEPYETRGYYRTLGGPASQGGDREWFTRDTWVQRDICDHVPWPFRDKQFDFAICSHTLEDVRDPLWVCAELVRVARRGYVEVPSREWESCRGIERAAMVGMSHHRWFVEISGTHVQFTQKYHVVHTRPELSLPPSHLRSLPPERTVQWLWWDGAFTFAETCVHGTQEQERALKAYADSIDVVREPWPTRLARRVRSLPRRIARRVLG